MHSTTQRIKHPEGFRGVNILLWREGNMSNAVYCHFYLDLPSPPHALQLWRIFRFLSPSYCTIRCPWQSSVRSEQLSWPHFFHREKYIPCSVSLPARELNFTWNLLIFRMAPSAKTAVIVNNSQTWDPSVVISWCAHILQASFASRSENGQSHRHHVILTVLIFVL